MQALPTGGARVKAPAAPAPFFPASCEPTPILWIGPAGESLFALGGGAAREIYVKCGTSAHEGGRYRLGTERPREPALATCPRNEVTMSGISAAVSARFPTIAAAPDVACEPPLVLREGPAGEQLEAAPARCCAPRRPAPPPRREDLPALTELEVDLDDLLDGWASEDDPDDVADLVDPAGQPGGRS